MHFFLDNLFFNKDYFLICGLYIKWQVQGLSAQWTFTDIWDLFSMPYFSPIVPGAAYTVGGKTDVCNMVDGLLLVQTGLTCLYQVKTSLMTCSPAN